jgi:class I fructose-bisphosphate aldolase
MNTLQWEIGKSLRMSRLFDRQTGNSVLVAMDHSFAGRDAPAMILSIDYVLFHAFPGDTQAVEEQGIVCSVEEAVHLGADAIKVLMIFGRDDPALQTRNFDMVGRMAETCHRWGIPIIVEPTTWGHRIDAQMAKKSTLLRDMARIAFEFGADIVKIDAPENPADFEMVAASCPVPVLVLGGAKKPDMESLLRDVAAVVAHGARGVTFGRNIWQDPQPARIIRSLKKVVYAGDIEGALAEMRDQEIGV